MLSRLLSLMRKECLQLFRDWLVIVLILYTFAEPVLCGLSLFFEVKHMPLAVVDADRSQASRALVSKLSTSEHFDLYARPDSPAGLEPLFERDQVRMGLVIPTGFERDLSRGDTARVQVIADGSNANTAAVATGYAEQIIGAHSRRIELQRVGVAKETVLAQLPLVVNRIQARYDPDLRFTNFLMVVMIAAVIPIRRQSQMASQ